MPVLSGYFTGACPLDRDGLLMGHYPRLTANPVLHVDHQ
jgi:hypothetical protein